MIHSLFIILCISMSGIVASVNDSKNSELLMIMIPITLVCLVMVMGIIIYYLCLKRKSGIFYSKFFSQNKPTGIVNLGSTCYKNCIIQALSSSELFVNKLNCLRNDISESPALNILLELIESINDFENEVSAEENAQMVKSLSDICGWNKHSQQDAYEFLCTLINSIHNDLKAAQSEMVPPMKFEMVHRLYGHNDVNTIQYHIGLNLNPNYIEDGRKLIYLTDLISRHFYSKPIADSNDFLQLRFLKDLPEILLFHIQTNNWSPLLGTMLKKSYSILYNKKLELVEDIVTKLIDYREVRESANYELKAVIEHIGTSFYGHYITYKNFNGDWFRMNDEKVKKINFDCKISPYLLVYEKN